MSELPKKTGMQPQPSRDEPKPTAGEPNPPAVDHEEKPAQMIDNLSQWQLIRIRFLRHKAAVASMFLLLVLYAMAIGAEFVAPYKKDFSDINYIYCPPQMPKFSFEHGFYTDKLQREKDPVSLKNYYVETGEIIKLGFFVEGQETKLVGLIPWDTRLFGAKSDQDAPFYFLGADKFGRDLFSRLVYGARISLSIGIVSIITTFFLGAIIGGISGYMGGTVDMIIQRAMEIINAFPQLPLWLALAAIMPGDWSPVKQYFAITVVLSIFGWTGLARLVRGKILSLREEDYAVAASLLGASHSRILFRHLLPGFTSHIIVSLSLSVPGMILGETALSFLGLGLRPPVVSWGVMLQECLNIDIVANYPWLLMPVIFIILTVLCFNFFGDGMRDAADPYAR